MKKTLAFILIFTAVLALAACGGKDSPAVRPHYSEETHFDGAAHDVSVFFVNVGKADCAVVSVDSHFWLVDTGTEASFMNVYAALRLLGAESIDGVILTHCHSDHIGGLYALARGFSVGRVCSPAIQIDRTPIDSAVYSNGLSGMTVKEGDTIPVSEDVFFEVMAPSKLNEDDDNDNSLVVMLRANGRSFLFTGDMQFAEDTILAGSGKDIACDVLKVANHGNPDATSQAFAEAASAQIAVISTNTSVDKNSANPIVIEKLGAELVLVTQEHELGVLVTVSRSGVISASFPERPEAMAAGLRFISVSKSEQSFTLANESGEELDLSGWFVRSTKGNEVFVFPAGTRLEPNGALLVACKNSSAAPRADLIWNEKKAWADKKSDAAVLYDLYGSEIAEMPSE